jgi:dihydrofolate reductase
MRRIFLFMNATLDGYFEGPGHDISWAHAEPEAFSVEVSREVDTILLGRRTYDLMKSFWPMPEAAEADPDVAEFMNDRLKLVASLEPFDPGWRNVRVISADVAGEVRKLKEQPGKDMIILGSNNLCVSLMEEGLVDEFQILVNPVALGKGTSLFAGLEMSVKLTLTEFQKMRSGSILLKYRPADR